jgi:hypothetical protein
MAGQLEAAGGARDGSSPHTGALSLEVVSETFLKNLISRFPSRAATERACRNSP